MPAFEVTIASRWEQLVGIVCKQAVHGKADRGLIPQTASRWSGRVEMTSRPAFNWDRRVAKDSLLGMAISILQS